MRSTAEDTTTGDLRRQEALNMQLHAAAGSAFRSCLQLSCTNVVA